MIGFKVNVLLTRLAGKLLNKIGTRTATFKREFFFSVLKASVITPQVTSKVTPYQTLLDLQILD